MSRGTYEPTVTTPLLNGSQRIPTAPATSAGTNGFAVHPLANGSSRLNYKPNPIPKPTSSVDKITIQGKEYVGSCTIDGRQYRKWRVVIAIDGQPEREPIDLVDPFTAEEYDKRDNHKVRRGKLQLLDKDRAKRYFNALFKQLNLSCCRSTDRRISIHEDVTKISESSDFASVHSLLWEVLEHPEFWPCSQSDGGTPVRRVRLSRTLNVLSTGSNATPACRQASTIAATQAEYRVLLVIARSFKKDSDQRYVDYRPNLIQGPLLQIARKAKQRGIAPKVHIDVVRPGTIEELDEYLNPKSSKSYDIVHFDMHGKIGPVNPISRSRGVRASGFPVQNGQTPLERQCYLRFAKPYDAELLRFKSDDDAREKLLTDDTSLIDVPVKQIAERLQECRISKVALSACLSSYAQSQVFLNMCHTFLSHDVASVSAMSFQILESTTQVYYTAFYESLILQGEAFHVAAARGREALRANNKQYGHAVLPTNYHRYPRSFSNEWWRSPQVQSSRLPPFALYLTRYLIVLCLLVLCLMFLWLPFWFFCILLPVALFVTMKIWVLTTSCIKKLTPVEEQVHEQRSEKPRFEVDIEHLVIEDRLKSEANQGALYVWSTDYSKELSDCVHDLAQTWVLTGFVDAVDIVSARAFSWTLSSLPPLRWIWTRRYRSEHKGTVGRRRLLVLKEFDRFYPKHARDEDMGDLHAALGRMVSFVEGYDRDDTYLLITGSYDEEWWTDGHRYNDERIVDTILRAVPHNHNITPARMHVPRWSQQAMKRRWSAFRKDMV
ncbi:hypothetical protein F4818DRAFT_403277 [Hypoxylon cercidicola]|nr:hypothetical protein F4818DRAFT_403277 [Hypoxylon cercidicola]